MFVLADPGGGQPQGAMAPKLIKIVQPLWNCFWQFSEIHATRWLLWHSDFTKFSFSRGTTNLTPLLELTTLPRPPSRLERGYPPHSPPPSTPKASRSRCRGLVPWRRETDTGGGP